MTLTDRETGVMIPKKLHYCWLSGDPFPPLVQHCMESWKKHCSDFEFILWDTKRFNVNQIPFVKEACAAKKWAFAADYIRLHALHEMGGIYLDSDVEVIKDFSAFTAHHFFSSNECHPDEISRLSCKEKPLLSENNPALVGLQAAVIGSKPRHELLKECMNFYSGKHHRNIPLAPTVLAKVAQKYGYRCIDLAQAFGDGVQIYPSYIFAGAPHEANIESFAIHHCAGSWRKP